SGAGVGSSAVARAAGAAGLPGPAGVGTPNAFGPAESDSPPVLPSAVVIDLAPGTTGTQRAALVSRIVSANLDGTPGGTYELQNARASAIVKTEQKGRQPLAPRP